MEDGGHPDCDEELGPDEEEQGDLRYLVTDKAHHKVVAQHSNDFGKENDSHEVQPR